MAKSKKGKGGKIFRKVRLSEEGKRVLSKALPMLAFAILGICFLISIIGPSIHTYIARDNHYYTEKYSNPNNYEVRAEAYNEYTQTVYNYKHSSNPFVCLFFNANMGWKLVLIAVAIYIIYPFTSKTYKYLTTK